MVILPLMCKKDLLLAQVSGRSFFFENTLSSKKNPVWQGGRTLNFSILRVKNLFSVRRRHMNRNPAIPHGFFPRGHIIPHFDV